MKRMEVKMSRGKHTNVCNVKYLCYHLPIHEITKLSEKCIAFIILMLRDKKKQLLDRLEKQDKEAGVSRVEFQLVRV